MKSLLRSLIIEDNSTYEAIVKPLTINIKKTLISYSTEKDTVYTTEAKPLSIKLN
ncbi:hypothetical protein PKHYL_10030 [Psychrobacter sp. KH172YL61]|nr:hypothetical protein PKHYL_10030 [Psychrobacter sp. KH172YL61]